MIFCTLQNSLKRIFLEYSLLSSKKREVPGNIFSPEPVVIPDSLTGAFMRLYNSYILLFVFLWIPLLIVFFAVASRMRDKFLNNFSTSQQKEIINISIRNIWLKRILLFFSLLFLTFAAARPQMGHAEVHLESEGINMAFLFDVSLSMLAEDEEGPRYEKGRQLVIDAISELKGDRIALVPFAGSAFLQLPLTSDYNTAFALLSTLRPGIINDPGSSLVSAFDLAVETLKSSPDGTDRLIVLISDGEDPGMDFSHIKNILEKERIRLAVLPLGSPEGAPIKVGENYLRTEKGEMVISKQKREFFERCVDQLKAQRVEKGESLAHFVSTFKNRMKMEEKQISLYDERFQIPLFLGILLFLLFKFIPSGAKRER